MLPVISQSSIHKKRVKELNPKMNITEDRAPVARRRDRGNKLVSGRNTAAGIRALIRYLQTSWIPLGLNFFLLQAKPGMAPSPLTVSELSDVFTFSLSSIPK